MFRMIEQLWNTNTPAIVSGDADMTENYMYISIKFRYFAGKLMYLIVLASNQLAVIHAMVHIVLWRQFMQALMGMRMEWHTKHTSNCPSQFIDGYKNKTKYKKNYCTVTVTFTTRTNKARTKLDRSLF